MHHIQRGIHHHSVKHRRQQQQPAIGLRNWTDTHGNQVIIDSPHRTKFIKGHLTAALTLGGSATGTIDYAINCGDSGSVTVYDSNSDFSDDTGTKHFMAVYDSTHSKWELIWVAC